MAPQFVKPYVKRGKNDANDAEAICEAVSRPNMRFVAAKTVDAQTLQAEHRIRARLVRSRTALSNEMRGLLAEFGIIVPTSLGALRRALPDILEDGENGLICDFRILLAELAEELRSLDDRVKFYDARMQARARTDERSRRLLAVEGIGPVVASARAALNAAANKTDPHSRWITALAARRNKNIATVALANKNARIAWAILARGEAYRAAA